MPHPCAVINVVGLNQSLIGDGSPNLQRFAADGSVHHLKPDLPAVTCTVQSSMLTGLAPGLDASGNTGHGIVGNGWYNRQMSEVQFWKQSNKWVEGPKVWETARSRDASVTCLNMFWWYNMYSSADWSVTPRPMYKADGRKIPDCYSNPPQLRDELQAKLGQFPLFSFWGPAASIKCSRWIADATMVAHTKFNPTLTLVYLPHLDYALQKLGPQHSDLKNYVREIDDVVGDLLAYFKKQNVRVMIVSEYGIEPVDDAVHINRALREAGHLGVRVEQGLELLDAGASEAFAGADHQLAHVYVADESKIDELADFCRGLDGVEQVYNKQDQAKLEIKHERSGELVLISDKRRWFSYDYWLDDRRAPDFARTVDIHRKPGYDPLELFIDPKLCCPKLKIAWRLFQRKVLGQRALIDVIPLDTKLVRGSHGRIDQDAEVRPVLLTQAGAPLPQSVPRLSDSDPTPQVSCRAVRDVILAHLFDS